MCSILKKIKNKVYNKQMSPIWWNGPYINFLFKQNPVIQPSPLFHPHHQKCVLGGQINSVQRTEKKCRIGYWKM